MVINMTYKINDEQKLYSKRPECNNWTNESKENFSNEEEYTSSDPLSFVELGEVSPLIEMQPTEDEKRLVKDFYTKFIKEKALEGIKHVVDKYLGQGLRLNLRYRYEDENESETVTNLIFGKVLDAISDASCLPTDSRRYGFSDVSDNHKYDDESEQLEKDSEIIKCIVRELVSRGGKIRYDFYHQNGR